MDFTDGTETHVPGRKTLVNRVLHNVGPLKFCSVIKILSAICLCRASLRSKMNIREANERETNDHASKFIGGLRYSVKVFGF